MSTVLQGETVMAQASFNTSLVWFFLRVSMSVTNRRLTGESQNYWLGIIPTGRNRITCPLGSISSVKTSTNFSVGAFIFGLMMSFWIFSFSLSGLIGGALGVLMLLSAFKTVISVTNNAGETVNVPVTIFQRQAAADFIDQVNGAISGNG